MQSHPLISVCVPVFNGERYIEECLTSVLCQGERNYELLIIDNCSTDRTVKICRKLTDPRVRLLQNTRNIGSNANFNECIRHARGELFMLLPADDLLEPDCLRLLSNAIIENRTVGIAFASAIKIDGRGKNIGMMPLIQQTGLLDSARAIRTIAKNFNPIQHPIVRSQVFSQVGGFNRRFGCFTDIHLWSRVLFYGWDAYYIGKHLTAIRQYKHQGQSLFRQNTKGNLRKLSSHYGRPLAPTFYKRNHYNLLFFWFVRFFHRKTKSVSEARSELETSMWGGFMRSHLSNVYSSILHLNLSSLMAEIALTARLLKLRGLLGAIHLYFLAIAKAFKHLISRTNVL